MWRLIMLLCAGYISADEVQTVTLEINKKALCTPIFSRRLASNEVFQFLVKTHIRDYIIESGSCYYNRNQRVLDYREGFLKYGYSTSNNLTATHDMNSDWSCKFKYNSSEQIDCSLNLNIVRNPVMGYLQVNGVNVSMTSHGQNMGLHSIGSYNFFNGQLAKISCEKADSDLDFRQLFYTNGRKIIATDLQATISSVYMTIKLTSDHDGAYIDCVISNLYQAPTLIYVTRIYFKLNSTYEATLGFQVNGLTLAASNNYGLDTDFSAFFHYNYYNSEELEIIVLKNEHKYGKLKCSSDELECFNDNCSLPFKTILKNEIKITTLSCQAEVRHIKYGSKKNDITLYLMPNIKHNLYIAGLSNANILLHYHKNLYSQVIEYEYDADTSLHLECYSITQPEWTYNVAEIEVNSSTTFYDKERYLHMIASVIKLNQNQTSAVLKCISPQDYLKRETTLTLIRKKNNNTGDNNAVNRGQEFNTTNFIFAVCGPALVVVVVVALIMVDLRKRKYPKQNLDPTTMNYESLPRHNEGPMPVPSQCSEYAIPGQTAQDGTSTVPYTRPVHAMYSTPLPKNQRPPKTGVRLSELQRSVVAAYAAVGNRQETERGVDNYAVPSIPNITNPGGIQDPPSDQYENLFDNEHYANVNTVDDTELYSELNVNK